jgi:large subunit ribosomal protein L23
MAIFGSKKNTKEKKDAPKKEAKAVAAPAPKQAAVVVGVKDVLMRPRITEKAANMTAQNVYTFDIRMNATKKDVTAAIVKLYKVTPVKIRVVNTPGKRVRMKTRRGFGKTNETRKAYVYLKKGEEIQFA